MSKTALIVDDSASARFVLGRLLQDYDLAVDTAESAEKALDYLKHQRPDVIFMDHLMPGMDGFQAVKAIKANPATATIPIMMYTSQEGEVYVGQARALGAVGVLPKQVKPVEVSKVLSSLNLVEGGDSAASAEAQASAPAAEVEPELPEAVKPDTSIIEEIAEEVLEETEEDISYLLRDLFAQQEELLKAEIENRDQRLLQKLDTQSQANAGAWWPMVALALGVLGLVLGLAVNERGRDQARLEGRLAEALEATEAPPPQDRVGSPAQAPDAAEVANIVAWGFNRGGQYRFDEIALDDFRAVEISEFVDRLRTVGFEGTVEVSVHAGRHCFNVGEDGRLVLPLADTLVPDCAVIGLPDDEALALTERQTLGFANTIATINGDIENGIFVAVRAAGHAEPEIDYPTIDATAGAWNAIADANHRIEVALLPE